MTGREDTVPPGNRWLSGKLLDCADLLQEQQADNFRIAAYRRASDVLERLDEPVSRILAKGGREALEALPAIGSGIAGALAEMVATGRWTMLERLHGELDPEALFRTVPGIGPELAARIHENLHVESLEELELASHDGRLETVPGFGPRRLQIVRAALSERLGSRRLQGRREPARRPDVATLLDVDEEYRNRAEAGSLRLIAPRRFNPSGEAWLPVLHTRRGEWEFTALFSNSSRAHALGRTHDWVVIYHSTEDQPEGQCTVVTERNGALAGRRVVRGREEECREFAGRQEQKLHASAATPSRDGEERRWS
jgi:hypothetical protein